MLPVMNASGVNTAARVMVMAMMANAISLLPASAARYGDMPSSMCRCTFSSITMASSTTRPMARTSPSRVRMLMVKPMTYRKMNAPISDTGMVTNGIRVARTLRRNKKITSTTSTSASNMAAYTALIDSSTNTERSKATWMRMPSGRPSRMRGSISFTAWPTLRVLALDCLTMPRPTAGLPFTRTALRSSSAPISA